MLRLTEADVRGIAESHHRGEPVPVTMAWLAADWLALRAENKRLAQGIKTICNIYYEFVGEGDQALASCLSEYIDAADKAARALLAEKGEGVT